MVVHVCPSCKFFYYVFGCAPHTENVVIIPLPNKRFSCALIDNTFFFIFVMKNILAKATVTAAPWVFPDNREFKKITKETATAMSLNERFNEQKNGCARPL